MPLSKQTGAETMMDAMLAPDPYRLERFVAAQDASGTYYRALDELRAGRKRTHWMWFVFPQLDGLGHSALAREYAIGSLAEARAYLAHPVLGERLLACADVLLAAGTPGTLDAEAIFGSVDAMKLRSSMTLFAAAAPPDVAEFDLVLRRAYGGERDEMTLALMRDGRT